MFDGLTGMMKLLSNKDKIAAEVAKLQETMGTIVGEGTAGGLVAVRVTGKMQVLSVKLLGDAARTDRELLEGVIAAATNQALASAREQVAAETQKLAQSLGLPPAMLANLPGLG